LAVIVGAKIVSKKIPGALLAVAGATLMSWAAGLDAHVAVLGDVPSGLPVIALPDIDWDWALHTRLLSTSFAMFIVILAQSAATSRAYATRYGERFSENTDLVGLALANFGAGLSGTFVVNGSPTKTQMVDSAGGRTQLSLLVMCCVVLLVLLFLTAPLAYMPEAVLSAVVFLIGIDLVDVAGMRKIFHERRAEFWVALVTALMVIFVGVEQGILLATALSLISHTRHGYRPRNSVLVPTDSGNWEAQPVSSAAEALPGLIVYRFSHSMYYANCQQMSDEIAMLLEAAKPPLRWLCIDASAVDDVDFSAAEVLRSSRKMLADHNVRLVVADALNLRGSRIHRQFCELFGEAACYPSLEQVVDQYRREASTD
jgi:MFS superfamily sulfate permease-like transporter